MYNMRCATKDDAAKYKHGIDIKRLEMETWKTGIPTTDGNTWKVKKMDNICGAYNGKEVNYMVVKESAGFIHGHPINEAEYKRLLKKNGEKCLKTLILRQEK